MGQQSPQDRSGDPQSGLPRRGGPHSRHCPPREPALHLVGGAPPTRSLRTPRLRQDHDSVLCPARPARHGGGGPQLLQRHVA